MASEVSGREQGDPGVSAGARGGPGGTDCGGEGCRQHSLGLGETRSAVIALSVWPLRRPCSYLTIGQGPGPSHLLPLFQSCHVALSKARPGILIPRMAIQRSLAPPAPCHPGSLAPGLGPGPCPSSVCLQLSVGWSPVLLGSL